MGILSPSLAKCGHVRRHMEVMSSSNYIISVFSLLCWSVFSWKARRHILLVFRGIVYEYCQSRCWLHDIHLRFLYDFVSVDILGVLSCTNVVGIHYELYEQDGFGEAIQRCRKENRSHYDSPKSRSIHQCQCSS